MRPLLAAFERPLTQINAARFCKVSTTPDEKSSRFWATITSTFAESQVVLTVILPASSASGQYRCTADNDEGRMEIKMSELSRDKIAANWASRGLSRNAYFSSAERPHIEQ